MARAFDGQGYRPRISRACNLAGASHNKRSGTKRYFFLGRELPYAGKRFPHDACQAQVDFVFSPEEARKVLHPFEIAYGHAAGICDNVGNDQDALAHAGYRRQAA